MGPARGDIMTDFNAVPLGEHTRNACTPDTPEDFVGIRIAAPAKVVFGQDAFALCGTYRFAAEYLYRFPRPTGAIVVVAVDARTHRPYAANLLPENAPPVPAYRPPKDPDWMANHFIRRYVNVNLLDFLPDLPRVSTDYWVYALIERHVSNVLTVSCRG
jgi:hypothetical protein